MSRRLSPSVLYSVVAVACLVLTAMSGTAYGVGTAGLLGAVAFASLALLAWRRARILGAGQRAAVNWWRYLVAGAAGLAGCVVVANVGGELPEGTWFVWITATLASLVLLVVGLVLGASRLHARRTA